MNGEPIKFLKLSVDPVAEGEAVEKAPVVVEEFLDQLDGEQEVSVLRALLSGDSLVAKFGEEEGRELAAYRLAGLLPIIGESTARLADIIVLDVPVEGRSTSTAIELKKLTN